MYEIVQIGNHAVELKLITELQPSLPKRVLYLCFASLKKDKNEWILQKGTELGVSHFVPLISERTEKLGWDEKRAQKIVIEAAEQCGRTDIPRLREPLKVQTLIHELQSKTQMYVAEQGTNVVSKNDLPDNKPIAVLVGPEGGWSDAEKSLFDELNIEHLSLGQFTLRAETAAITAAALLQSL